jgi:hypothetical protein
LVTSNSWSPGTIGAAGSSTTEGAVLDIAPTLTMYDDTSKEFATKYVWWLRSIKIDTISIQSRKRQGGSCNASTSRFAAFYDPSSGTAES